MRVVFMGSPGFAIPSLAALVEAYAVVGVVTQPDRPAGRGRKRATSPVKQFAIEHGLPCLQPETLRTPASLSALTELRPDLVVVAAFGQILPAAVLALPPHGCLNVHASLLPRWRGAAPVQAAILQGDAETGVTIMRMDPGLDTGPILAQRTTAIGPEDTGGSLSARLSVLGADLLIEILPDYLGGRLTPMPQDDALATRAPSLKKDDGALDPAVPAERLARQVRAYEPWPGSFVEWDGRRLGVHRARVGVQEAMVVGQAFEMDGFPALGTVSEALVLLEVQPEGKRRMAGSEFLRGSRSFVGSRIQHG
jgi:methionyl-tRNA formyltransferase